MAEELTRRGALAPGVSHQSPQTPSTLATDESVYLRLTRDCGWTAARHADLVARTRKETLVISAWQD